MAMNNGTYRPDERALGLLSELEQGTIDEGGLEYLKALYQKDPNFAAFYTTWKSALNGKRSQQAGTQRANRSERNSYLQSRNSASGYSSTNRTISPGGFKKSGLDEDSMARRSGTMTDPNFAKSMVDFKTRKVKDADGNVSEVLTGVSYGRGKSKRTYNADRLQWIMDRGSAGATLSQADQVVYDAMMQREAKARERQEEANAIGAYAKANADKNAIKLQEENRKLQQELAKMRYETEFKANLKREEQKVANEEFNERYGVDPGVVLSKREKQLIINGDKIWGYTAADQKEVDQINADMSNLRRDSRYNDEDKARMLAQYQKQLDGYKKRLVNSKEPLTADQVKASFDTNGFVMIDGKPVFPQESPAEKRRAKELKAEEDKRNAEEKARKEDEKNEIEYLTKGAMNWIPDPKNPTAEYPAKENLEKYRAMKSLVRGNAVTPTNVPPPEVAPEATPQIESQSVEQPTETIAPIQEEQPSNGRLMNWRNLQDGSSVGELEQPPAEPSEDNFYVSAGLCPQCGAELDASGFCAACGYQAQM